MDLTPNHKLKDFVEISRAVNHEGAHPVVQREAKFPEILRDEYGTYVGILTLQGERIEDPMVAFLLDLIRWGNQNLSGRGSLKTPIKEGEEVNVPDFQSLPREKMRGLPSSRPLHQFFEFNMEMPPGVKWSPKNEKKRVRSTKNFHLPMVCVGVRGFSQTYGPHGTGFDAACIAAIEMGHKLTTCDNGISNLHVDDSAERLAHIKGRMEAPDFVRVVEDSGWSLNTFSSIPQRGIRDFNRTVRFERKPTPEEMTLFKEMMGLDECPGYTGIHDRAKNETTYTFSTTWDSSD